jgi:cytochrome c
MTHSVLKVAVSTAAMLLVLSPAAVLSADGEKLYKTKTCSTCHGKDGKTPIMPMYPKIAGQSKEYTLQQMADIKSGARSNGQSAAMKGVMHLVSEEEMQALAEYIASMAP